MGAIPSSLRYRAPPCPSRNVADAGEAVGAFSSRTVSKGPTSLPGARSPETRSKFRRCGPSWRRSLTNRSMRTEMWSYRISRFQGRKVTGKFARFAATDVSATRSPSDFVKSFVALRTWRYLLNYYCIIVHLFQICQTSTMRIIRMIDIEGGKFEIIIWNCESFALYLFCFRKIFKDLCLIFFKIQVCRVSTSLQIGSFSVNNVMRICDNMFEANILERNKTR